ncbi:MAG: DUF1704 domain-containing protein, partial [Leptospirales bacterium]
MYATYKERIKSLSKQLVEAQQSLRILQALRIHDDTEQAVLRSNFRELPRVDAAYYHERNPLPFDPERLVAQFDDLKNQIEKNPGREDDLGAILWRNCQEYQDAVRMLQARGTPDFYEFSRKLYGGPADFFPGDQTTIHDSASQLYDILTPMKQEKLGFVDEKNLSAEQVVEDL